MSVKGEPKPDAKHEPAKPKVIVTQRERGLEAYVRIMPPVPMDPDDLRAALTSAGVFEGLDQDKLLEICRVPPDHETLIARGRPPENGQPGRIDYFFTTEEGGFNPLEDEHGRANYREAYLIQNVAPGQLLARRTPPTEGVPGRAVNGEPVPATNGKDVNLLTGKNVELSSDRTELYATVTGIPELLRGRVTVLPVFNADEVDFTTGNISFTGSVYIRGNVNPGFVVRATEDITVEKNVEQATLEAGGSILVKGGARSTSKLIANKDIRVRFCDSNSSLKADGEIHVMGDSVHCTLQAGHSITVDNRLIGGAAQAMEAITAGTVGTAAETPTRIELVQVDASEEMERLRDEISQLELDIAEVSQQIQIIMTHPEKTNTALLQRLTPAKVNMNIRLAQLRSQLQEIVSRQTHMEPPKFVIKHELHPGVTVHFQTLEHQHTQRIMSKQLAKTYHLVDGEIHA